MGRSGADRSFASAGRLELRDDEVKDDLVKRVVVGIDGSAPDGLALDTAALEARVRGAMLEVVSVWAYPPMSTEERMMVSARQVEDEAHSVAARVVAETFGAEGDRDIEVHLTVVRGAPAIQLLDAAEGSELLVVGRRDKSRVRHLLLGSVADQCVRHAPCPMMVVPHVEDAVPWDGPIVVGVDGSEDSLRSLGWAADEARLRELPLLAVFAWAPWTIAPTDFGATVPDVERLELAATAQLDDWIASSVPDNRAVTPVLRWGDPAEVLLSEAQGAAMVVMGSRGRGGFAGLLLGSVSRKLVHTAPCPVVVLPNQD
jgi:nucleotide-binding universal stress UspA family protein